MDRMRHHVAKGEMAYQGSSVSKQALRDTCDTTTVVNKLFLDY
jgi:hypothetical protein